MNATTEKDNFWLYIGILVAVIIGVLMAVKSSEHDKFETTKKAIQEEASFSAYPAKK